MKVNFPYISDSDDYYIEIEIIDYSAWMYKQEGYYAHQDSPIDITLGANVPLSEPIIKGGTIDVLLSVTNTSDTGTYYIRLKEPIQFSYEEEGSLKEYYAYGDMWTEFPIQVNPSLTHSP